MVLEMVVDKVTKGIPCLGLMTEHDLVFLTLIVHEQETGGELAIRVVGHVCGLIWLELRRGIEDVV